MNDEASAMISYQQIAIYKYQKKYYKIILKYAIRQVDDSIIEISVFFFL